MSVVALCYESPESRVSMPSDVGSRRSPIEGERPPSLTFGLCDNCLWCCTSINEKGIVKKCPVCNGAVSQIPLGIDEVSVVEKDEKRGLTLRFSRGLLLR